MIKVNTMSEQQSTQQSPLSAEVIFEMFRQTDLKMQETDRQLKEVARVAKETEKKISELGSRIGEIIEHMVAGNIVAKFRAFGYQVTDCSRNKEFQNEELGISGEIDLLLEDGDVVILIEVKTTLVVSDVRNHIERLEKYRRHINAKGINGKRRFIGAVAGAVLRDDAVKFAQKNGMYVIVQSGEAVRIIPPPEGFVAKEW